ncbi:hypothetical protein [Candidatus Laterigemmans baculatus]|uniref:hypothetical protein n=1 Tax=Candidatus Laterigemmans baculatus TaxID=2770505 RepID=UPI001F42123C|nr:hypothetical protein [Candidatus Laterigemmans baculatus]
MRTLGVEPSVTCACSGSEKEPCGGDNLPPSASPCDCPYPCDSGCACQFMPELNSRTVTAEFELSFDLAPVFFGTPDFSHVFPCEEHPRRLDLESGRTVRLAFASLLI